MSVNSTLKKLRAFISSYLFISDPAILYPISYWIAGTYIYESFDSFPYMVITAMTKRSGKTRLSELIAFTCNMPFRVAGATAASLFHAIQQNKPTIIWDEAESLSSEASSVVRAFLNVGYRKGQTIPRTCGSEMVDWPTYCPKVFVLIGHVFDTLRDRSIIVRMTRGKSSDTENLKRFSYEQCKAEGAELIDELRAMMAENASDILDAYEKENLAFLTDRDEEIWRCLFAIGKVLEPDAYKSMKRTSVDMATEKTAPVKVWGNQIEKEERAEKEEYATRLLKDLASVTANVKAISSSDAITKLREIDVAPWRKYQGDGLNMNMLADLLNAVFLAPKVIRIGKKVYRGYTRADILSAVKKANL